ncbi:MAG TPA: DUF6691 family protein [Methylocystis sp.]|nr:DUF6691 family protein [Methylocystis sp.]
MRAALIALACGLLFGAGLAVSGMTNPARVIGFLDIAGAFDPTLAFVMLGALAPMSLAWRLKARMERPLAAQKFTVPTATVLDAPLVIGALLFGVGWGVTGLCPGPALANLALSPLPAAVFVSAMTSGMALYRMLRPNAPSTPQE